MDGLIDLNSVPVRRKIKSDSSKNDQPVKPVDPPKKPVSTVTIKEVPEPVKKMTVDVQEQRIIRNGTQNIQIAKRPPNTGRNAITVSAVNTREIVAPTVNPIKVEYEKDGEYDYLNPRVILPRAPNSSDPVNMVDFQPLGSPEKIQQSFIPNNVFRDHRAAILHDDADGIPLETDVGMDYSDSKKDSGPAKKKPIFFSELISKSGAAKDQKPQPNQKEPDVVITKKSSGATPHHKVELGKLSIPTLNPKIVIKTEQEIKKEALALKEQKMRALEQANPQARNALLALQKRIEKSKADSEKDLSDPFFGVGAKLNTKEKISKFKTKEYTLESDSLDTIDQKTRNQAPVQFSKTLEELVIPTIDFGTIPSIQNVKRSNKHKNENSVTVTTVKSKTEKSESSVLPQPNKNSQSEFTNKTAIDPEKVPPILQSISDTIRAELAKMPKRMPEIESENDRVPKSKEKEKDKKEKEKKSDPQIPEKVFSLPEDPETSTNKTASGRSQINKINTVQKPKIVILSPVKPKSVQDLFVNANKNRVQNGDESTSEPKVFSLEEEDRIVDSEKVFSLEEEQESENLVTLEDQVAEKVFSLKEEQTQNDNSETKETSLKEGQVVENLDQVVDTEKGSESIPIVNDSSSNLTPHTNTTDDIEIQETDSIQPCPPTDCHSPLKPKSISVPPFIKSDSDLLLLLPKEIEQDCPSPNTSLSCSSDIERFEAIHPIPNDVDSDVKIVTLHTLPSEADSDHDQDKPKSRGRVLRSSKKINEPIIIIKCDEQGNQLSPEACRVPNNSDNEDFNPKCSTIIVEKLGDESENNNNDSRNPLATTTIAETPSPTKTSPDTIRIHKANVLVENENGSANHDHFRLVKRTLLDSEESSSNSIDNDSNPVDSEPSVTFLQTQKAAIPFDIQKEIDSWETETVKGLKDLCKSYGLLVKGNRKEIVKRLTKFKLNAVNAKM